MNAVERAYNDCVLRCSLYAFNKKLLEMCLDKCMENKLSGEEVEEEFRELWRSANED